MADYYELYTLKSIRGKIAKYAVEGAHGGLLEGGPLLDSKALGEG